MILLYDTMILLYDSIACTGFLCMHKILVHAQHSCACTTILCMHLRGQGPSPGPKEKRRPGPCCACTRVLCMHKNLVHAQESCACTGLLCMHKNLVHAQDSCACTASTNKINVFVAKACFFTNGLHMEDGEVIGPRKFESWRYASFLFL